jgi:hypothetical protein
MVLLLEAYLLNTLGKVIQKKYNRYKKEKQIERPGQSQDIVKTIDQ